MMKSGDNTSVSHEYLPSRAGSVTHRVQNLLDFIVRVAVEDFRMLLRPNLEGLAGSRLLFGWEFAASECRRDVRGDTQGGRRGPVAEAFMRAQQLKTLLGTLESACGEADKRQEATPLPDL
jgi:hypothetical protein